MKEHRYWYLVENRRAGGGEVVQRQVLYLGEVNDTQREVWRKSIGFSKMALPKISRVINQDAGFVRERLRKLTASLDAVDFRELLKAGELLLAGKLAHTIAAAAKSCAWVRSGRNSSGPRVGDVSQW